jgi:hypothetical protein
VFIAASPLRSVALRRGVDVVVRRPPFSDEASLVWAYDHPSRVPYARIADELLAACTDPALNRAELDALQPRDRHRLVCAVVAVCGLEREWQSLYGSHLSADERFFAVMLWRWRRHMRRALRAGEEALAPLRLKIDRMVVPALALDLPKINAVMPPVRVKMPRISPGSIVSEALRESLAQHEREWGTMVARISRDFEVAMRAATQLPSVTFDLRSTPAGQFIATWENSSLWFLIAHMEMGRTRALSRLERDDAEEALMLAIEHAVTDPSFIDALRADLSHVPFLGDAARDHLDHGLAHVGDAEWRHAVPPLLVGLEGALRATARRLNVMRSDDRYLGPPHKPVAGAQAVLQLLDLNDDYRRFMLRRVYADADDYRHGSAEDGERTQALLVVVGLAGWLDIQTDRGSLTALADAVSAAVPSAVDQISGPVLAGSSA